MRDADLQARDATWELAPLYDEEYFRSHCGLPYRRGDARWERFFGAIADAIVAGIRPHTVLDAGCAIGFLVEALRERGVDASGFDISEYAIAQVPAELEPYVWVASITDPIEQRYDLIVCIEVLEHLPEAHAAHAVANLCEHAGAVLFSSTPDDVTEATHRNVQPASYWAELFAGQGFFRDDTFDASVIAPHAVLLRPEAAGAHAAAHERLREDFLAARSDLTTAHDELVTTRDELVAARNDLLTVRSELLTLSTQLEDARREALEWQLVQRRAGYRIYRALFDVRARAAPPGTRRDLALRAALRGVAPLLERGEQPEAPPEAVPREPALRAVLILSGCPGDAFRYRGEHQVEQLTFAGATADAALVGSIDLGEALEHYSAFLLHRVAWDASIDGFVRAARERGKPVVFDTDDLVFDPSATRFVAALETMSEPERDLYVDGLRRYRRTLEQLDAASVSTEPLRAAAQVIVQEVEVVPNAVSEEMVTLADLAVQGVRTRSDNVTVAYFSGTRTHDKDFLEAADAVLWALEEYPSVRFLTVGHIALDERFAEFGDRVRHVPLQPWRSLPALVADVDVNLAPLEADNPFTDAKSCLKYLEAGLAGVPTIASPRADFVRAISAGENGLLAEGHEEWRAALKALVDSPEERRRMGRRAFQDVRANHTTRARAHGLHRTFAGLLGAGRDEPLRINWVLRAPIAQRGGGYRTIFRLAEALAVRGHHVRIHVERIAHLSRMTDAEVVSFVDGAFGPLTADVVVGHALEPADLTIATNWPTAPVVAEHDRSLFKAYFIQDYEPEFYEPDDPHHAQADRTYRLPLRQICYGRHLANRIGERSGLEPDTVDFALEPAFRMTVPPAERAEPPKVLFFARPDQGRRGFELGVQSLERVHRAMPEAEILLFGCPDRELPELPFPARNLGVLTEEDLAHALNTAHVFLSFSLTNISHAPYEAMACGCAVVEADLPGVRAMVDPGACVLAELTPAGVAAAVEGLLRDRERRLGVAARGIEATAGLSWEASAAQFEEIARSLAFVRLGASV